MLTVSRPRRALAALAAAIFVISVIGVAVSSVRADAASGNRYSYGSGETARHNAWETYVPAGGDGATTYSFQGFMNDSTGCNGNIGIYFSFSYNTQALHGGEYLAVGASAVLSDGRNLSLGDYKVNDRTAWPGRATSGNVFSPPRTFVDSSYPAPHVVKLEVHTFIADGSAFGVPEHSATATVRNDIHSCKVVRVRKNAESIAAPANGSNGGFENAFQANTSDLWTSEPAGTAGDWQAGMAPGTNPSIAAVRGGYEVALQTNTNDLWLLGTDGDIDTGLGMMPGTSPSITPLFSGGYEVAFQANTGELWTYGSAGEKNWGAGMAPATSPSITWHGGSGYEVALQTNTGDLWTLGDAGDVDWTLGMAPGTSPSITVLATDGYEVAFNGAGTNDMWTAGTAGPDKDWGAGMDPASSPSITAATGGFEVAFQTNTHDLWTLGTDGYNDWNLGMAPGTSPAIGSVSSGGVGYEMAFQANTGNLWNAGTEGTGGNLYGMSVGTSPAITSV